MSNSEYNSNVWTAVLFLEFHKVLSHILISFQWYRESLGMNCFPVTKGSSWLDTTAWKCPVQCESQSLLLDIWLWLSLSFPLESEVTLSGPVWLTVHRRYNSTKGADVDLISLLQIGKWHFWDGQRSMDFPSPRLSWMRPLSYTGEAEASHKKL